MKTISPASTNNSRIIGGCKCSSRQSSPGKKTPCITVDTPFEKPDLATYSQDEQIGSGNIPTWNSPDILTNVTLPFKLLPEAEITVRNLSATPASNALVHIFTSPFGIGTQETIQLSQLVNIGGGQQITLKYPWSQAILEGDQRVGIHIRIEHPYDEKLINNFGSQVIDAAYTSVAGRNFSILVPVVNNSAFNHTLQFQVLPTDINATLNASSHVFAPFEQINLALHSVVPNFLHGTPASPLQREITVVARQTGGTIIGGTTLIIYIDN